MNLNHALFDCSFHLQVLPHENFDERLLLCEQPTDFPFWWKPGVCDKELLLGVSRYESFALNFQFNQSHEDLMKTILFSPKSP